MQTRTRCHLTATTFYAQPMPTVSPHTRSHTHLRDQLPVLLCLLHSLLVRYCCSCTLLHCHSPSAFWYPSRKLPLLAVQPLICGCAPVPMQCGAMQQMRQGSVLRGGPPRVQQATHLWQACSSRCSPSSIIRPPLSSPASRHAAAENTSVSEARWQGERAARCSPLPHASLHRALSHQRPSLLRHHVAPV